jgi:hypothetical protein
MDKIQKFIDGTSKAIQIDNVMITQDILPNGYRFTTIKHDDLFLYEFWADGSFKTGNKVKKHTGGKPSYAKVYLNKLKQLKKIGIDAELPGYMIWLSDNIEWGTGSLYTGRGKNRKPVQFKDLMSIWNTGRTKTSNIISRLKDSNLLTVTSNGYQVSTDFMQKGGAKQ